MRNGLILLLAALTLLPAPTLAKQELSPLEEQEKAAQKYRRAYFKHVKSEVRQGFPEARLTLAKMYLWGMGVKQNYKKAYRSFDRCAKGKNPPDDCRYWQALMQYHGQGAKENKPQALKNLTALAEEGSAQAQYGLGLILLNKSAPADSAAPATAAREEGINRLARAADQGYPLAQLSLAREYMTGENIPQNPQKAFELMLRAAERESNAARYELTLMYLNGYGVKPDPSKAFHTLLPAAREKYARAQLLLADLYARGTGTQQSDFQAFTWTLRAAQLGHKEAQKRVSEYYRRGFGVNKNAARAEEWAKKAAKPAPRKSFFRQEDSNE